MEPFFSSPKQQGLEPLVVPLSPGHRSGEPAPVGESSKSFSIDGKPISEWKLVAQTAGPLLLAVAGSGLAPLPCAFSLAGIPAGIATLITLALLNDYTSIILVKAAGRAHTYGYEEIMLKGGGTLAQNATRAALVVLLFGTLCGSLSVIWETGQTAAAFLGLNWLANDSIGRVVLLLILLCGVLLPLSLASLGEMVVVSLVGVTMMGAFTVYVLCAAVNDGGFSRHLEPYQTEVNVKHLPEAASMLGFAFWLQPCVLPLMRELPPGPIGERIMIKACHITFGGSAVVYACVGLGGFLRFGRETPQDILNGFDGTVGGVLACLFCIYLSLCFPPVVAPLREVVVRMVQSTACMRRFRAHTRELRITAGESVSPLTGRPDSTFVDGSLLGAASNDARVADPRVSQVTLSPNGSPDQSEPYGVPPLLAFPTSPRSLQGRLRAFGNKLINTQSCSASNMMMTSVILFLVFLVVILLPDASATLFAFTGASGVCFISFIFPVLGKWWLHARSYNSMNLFSASWLVHYGFPALVLLIGVLISVLGLTATIDGVINSDKVCVSS